MSYIFKCLCFIPNQFVLKSTAWKLKCPQRKPVVWSQRKVGWKGIGQNCPPSDTGNLHKPKARPSRASGQQPTPFNSLWSNLLKNKTELEDFPGGVVVRNLPANAGDTGLSPGPGRSHTRRSNEAREPQLLSPRAATTEARAPRAHAPQQEKPPQ